MGGLSSGPGPGICFLALCLLVLAQQSQSAPVQEDNLSLQSRAQGYYDGSSSELSSGCYYNFQHYGEGDRIITNEPCLNCTCRNRMLMCYLRVCPFTKAIGQNCTIEKKPGQCCPLIICPEVPVQLLTSSTTTEHSESSHKTQLGYGHHGTGVGHLDDYGCRINGEFYTNGAQIPGNIDKPCEVCYCIRNRTACIMQECTLQVDGCIPVYEEGLCCPVRYQCDYDYSYNAITTEEPRPTPGLVLTTTSGPFECQHDGKWYADGSSVDTEDPCEHCYCMKGDIVCAVQECKPPFEKDGHNCTAMPPAPGKCCPDSYHCANVTMSITSSTSSSDKHHGWNYGTNANEKDTPNRFTDEQNKDGTTDEDGHMMITEGVPPTLGPLESGSHHLEGHYDGKPVSEGHGVNTDNMLTISQVIQSIVHNQTQLLNQNRLNQSMAGSGKPAQQPGGVAHDEKIHFPVDQTENEKRPPFHHMQTDEDGNPLESHSIATELPEDYYGFTGGSSDIYAEHSGRPQTRPTKPSKRPQPGQAVFGEHGHFGRPITRPGSVTTGEHEGTDGYQGMTDLPEGYTGQPGKRPITHKVPGTEGTSVVTDEIGNTMEEVTDLPDGFTGKPGTVLIYYDEHGKPHRRPIGHKPGMIGGDEATEVYEGVTGISENFTGRPGSVGTIVYYDEHGKPHTRPVGQKQPATNDETSTGESEGFTGKPGDHLGIFGEHGHSGRPLKRPIGQKRPGMTDDMETTGVYDEFAEGFTGKPGVHGSDEDRISGIDSDFTGRPGGIYKRPGVHMRPGMEGGITEGYEETTEVSEGYTSHHGTGMYGQGVRPHKRPGMTESVTNKDETLLEGVTKMPGHYDISGTFGEHGRPQKPGPGKEGVKVSPGQVEEMTETSQAADVTDDEYGQPKPSIHKKPAEVVTDENGDSIETATGSPEYHTDKPDSDEMEIIYDKYGRPHRRPIHKKPGMDEEVTTGDYEKGTTEISAFTETSDFVIMYDKHGRPIKLPVHKTPGLQGEYTPSDKDGKPVESEKEQTEGHTGAPNYVTYYDELGRPHNMPVGVKRPGVQVLTDENGKPLEGQEGITQSPEGFTAKPGDNEYTVLYDSHGRPIKRPIYKPGMNNEQISTDEYGNPVYGTTDSPDSDHTEEFYDEQGRPIKPTTVQKKPGMHGDGGMMDKHKVPEFIIVYDKNGRPIKKPIRKRPGVHYEQPEDEMTEVPESHTGKPDGDDEVFYDKYGNPIQPGIYHKEPGLPGEGIVTDEVSKPLDEQDVTTEISEGHTGTPEFMIVYDKNGKPIKKPIRKRPGVHGERPEDGVTETPEGQTVKPLSDDEVFYDKYGNPIRPGVFHKKPGMHGEGAMTDVEGKPLDEHEATTEITEDNNETSDRDSIQTVYDEHSRPVKPTTVHKKPEMHEENDVTDEHTETPDFTIAYDQHGRPIKKPIRKKPGAHGEHVPSETPESQTGSPGSDDEQQIVYDQHGRPIKPPTYTRPDHDDHTDKYGKPLEGITEIPEGHTGRPDSDNDKQIYDQFGRPIRPKPGMDDGTTDKPVGETVESQTGSETPEIFGEHGHTGRPYKKPVHGPEGVKVTTEETEGVTETPDLHTGKPDGEVHYDEHGQPIPSMHKKPGVDEDGKPMDEHSSTTETPEGHTGTPEFMIVYDKNGMPIKKPIRKRPGVHGEQPTEGMTETPEMQRPDEEVHYDEHGRPKPDVHLKPLEEHEKMTESSVSETGRPESDSFVVYFDKYGRPHRRPVHKKPDGLGDVLTDEQGNPLEGVTGTIPAFTGKPGTSSFFGEHGHTVRPDTRPGMTEEGDQTVEYEGTTKIPEIYGEHGHTGRPHKRPVIHKKPGVDMETGEYQTGRPEVYYDEDARPQKKPGKPEDGNEMTEGHIGEPHKRPVVQKKPGEHVMTDSITGKPEDGLSTPGEEEAVYGKPGETDVTDEDSSTGEPATHVKKPVTQKRPQGAHDTPEGETSTSVLYGTTETPDGYTTHPLFGEHGHAGRPHHKPAGQKYPDIHGVSSTEGPESILGTEVYYDEHGRPLVQKQPDTDGKPIDEQTGTTETSEGHTGTPEFMIVYDKNGNPVKKPIRKRPDIYGQQPAEGMTTTPEGHTDSPDSGDQVFYDKYGNPIRPGVFHKQPNMPGEGAVTDEESKPLDEQDGTTEISEGHTDTPEFMIVYDKNGTPMKKPIRKRPGLYGEHTSTNQYGKPIEGMTEPPEGQTVTPDSDDEVFYDKYGNPIRPGVFHKKPGMHGEGEMTDEGGKPLDEHEATTEFAESDIGTTDFMIVYDKNGRPIKKPIRKKPGMHDEHTSTDKYGKPVEGMTESPEGHTGAPDGDTDEVVYDKYGRPIGVHAKPGMDDEHTSTDKYGKPVYGTTETPESDDQETVFDDQGRPLAHKKPGMDGELKPTDEYGQSVEGMTVEPEAITETPDFVIMYDNHGRPIKMPVHKTPGLHAEYMPTDKDGVTEQTEGHTGEPDYVIFYDQFGRPHKMPVGHRPVLTDDSGKPVGEGSQTGKPEITVVYDEQGRPISPITAQKKPEEDGTTDEHTEDHTETPDFMIVYDQNGRPIKKPIHKKPVTGDDYPTTDKYGKPVEGMTDIPEDQSGTHVDLGRPVPTKPGMLDEHAPTDKYGKPVEGATEVSEDHTVSEDSDDQEPDHSGRPGVDVATTDKYGKPLNEKVESQTGSETPEIFGEHGHTGRPYKKPVHGPEGVKVTTEETEGVTETPDLHTGKPDGEVHYDEHGQPIPSMHKKPGVNEDGKPMDEHSGTTETPEGHTGTPEFMIVYDKNGKPIKKPIRKRPGVHGERPEDGVTEIPEGQTVKPHSDDEVFYDKYGNPIRPGVFHKKPGMHGEGAMTDVEGKPFDEHEATTEITEDNNETSDRDSIQTVYDEHGQPVKPTTVHKKPEMHEESDVTDEHTETPDFTIAYDQHGRPIKKPIRKKPGAHGEHVPSETPESQTGSPGSDDEQQIVYDQHGRPIKPPTYTRPDHDDHTDKYGKPLEGITEIPEGHTGRPDSDNDKPIYDQFSRPIRPKPGMDDGTTDKPVGETVESQTGSETPEIFGEHGHTGRPYKKPVHGPEGVKVTTEETEGMTETPDSHTGKPGGEVHYDEHGRPKPEIATDDDGKPVHGIMEGHTSHPDTVGSVTEHLQPQEKPTDGHGHPYEESVTSKPNYEQDLPQGKPDDEHSAVHPVHEYELVTMLPEDHTGRPESDSHHVIPDEHEQAKPQMTDDEMVSTGQPHSDQKRPVGGDDMTPEEDMVTSEDPKRRPGTYDVDHTTGSPVTHDEDVRPQEGSTVDDLHKRPQDIEQHISTVQDYTTGATEGSLESHSIPEDVTKVQKKPGDHGTEAPEDDTTGKPVEIHSDEFGQPHQRPTHTQTDDAYNELSVGITGKPNQEVPGLFGEPGHTGRPHKKPVTKPDDEMHTTELTEGFVHYDDQGRPQKKPVTGDDVVATEEPDSVTSSGTTEPQLFGESGRPHKKPIRKPGSGITDDGDHTQKLPGVEDHTGSQEEESTDKPDRDTPLTFFGESGRPMKKPVKPVDDDEEKPEENQILEGEKATELPEGEHVNGKPEGTKVAEPTHGTGQETEGESTTVHPEVSGQYLPPKKPDTSKEPEGTMAGKPHKPVQTTDGHPEEDDEEDDESLIITTDESEEETQGVHGHEGEKPDDTKTKIPEEGGEPHDEVHPTTPGLGSHSHDFTTPGYGTFDSSLPVTDGATHGHPVTQGVDGQPDLSHMGPDGVSFPGANVVFDKDGKPHIIPGHHGEFGPTPGYEDEVVPHGGDKNHHIQKPTSVSTPEDESTQGATTTIGGDGKPHTVPPYETTPDVKGKPERPLPEEGKPGSATSAGTTEKTSSHFPGIPAGFLPSFGEIDTPNTDAPIMIDGGLNEGSPFDAVLDSLANVLRPMQTTEKAAETTESHEEVPGEGSCFMDGVTYPNNSEVPPLSPCHTKCTCISSIIHCLSLKCPSPPEDVSHCTTVHDEKSCCPTYICDETSAEGQEVTTIQEDEHGLYATETPEKEDGQHFPVKTETQLSEMDAEKPEEHPATMKPEVDYAHPIDHEEPKPGSMMPGPTGIDSPTEDSQAATVGQTSEKPEESTITKPGRPQRPQSGYFPASSDEHHPSTALPSYFGTGKPITTVDKQHPDQQRPDSDDQVLNTDQPMKEDKKPGDNEQQPMTTDDDKSHEGMGEPDAPMKVTEAESAMPDVHTPVKKPDHHRPSTPDEGHPEAAKPQEAATSDDQEESVVRPQEKPDEASLEGHKPTGEETGDRKPEDNTESSEEHTKPSVLPTSMDEESALTTTSPQERPSGSEVPLGVEHHKPGVTGEDDAHGQLDHDMATTEVSEPGHGTNRVPVTHDTPSEEDKENKHPVTIDEPGEQDFTHTVATTRLPELTHPENESSDKVHTSPDHPTSEEHHKKPEDTTGEDVTVTLEQFATGKPVPPSVVFTDSQKKPEADAPEGQEPIHGMTEKPHDNAEGEEQHGESEAPQKKPEDGVLPPGEESGHTTTRPHEQSSEEGKPENVQPTSMDTESETTSVEQQSKPTTDTVKPQTDDDKIHTPEEESQEPQAKPEADSHSTSTDKEVDLLTTTRPHGEPAGGAEHPHPSTMDEEFSHTTITPHGHPSDTEEPHKSPEHDLVHPNSEAPQTGVHYSTTEGVDGHAEHDFVPTLGPHPEQSTPGQVAHKPEEIPEEVLLHPTRTPGTFQTNRPDLESDNETTDHRPAVDETMSTLFPEGFFRPVTKRPTAGDDKPEDSMTQRPQTERPDITPDNLAEVSGTFRPKPDFGDFLPGIGIFQKPDEDLVEHETTPHEEYTTSLPGLKPGPLKRPIYATNGTHFVQFVPFREGEAPKVPQGAMLGEPEERPDGEKYWPIIFVKQGVSTTEPVAETETSTPQQAFNGTHVIQYVPFKDGEKPEVPEGATLGQPVKKPDGEVYWPVIDIKPLSTGSEDEPVTHEPFPGQVYNGTHFIQYLPYDEGKPEVPEGATLGQPQTAPNGDKYWPIISTKPIPDEEGTTAGSVESQPEQIFNGTHFIQYLPFKDGEAPIIPEEATLGQPQKGPDGQIYWPIISTKPIPNDDKTATQVPPVQVFNGTNFIQYVPFKDGEAPEVPEGATLGQPQKTPDGELYWPIIYAKPQPVKPEESLPSQVFNGTHYIQYVPYEEDKEPEVPEGATLGQPQRTPDGQTFWPLIYTKPVTSKPEDEPVTTGKPVIPELFNGTHQIQYIPFEEGKEPEIPEGATLGQPQRTPDGQTFWPLIFTKSGTSKPDGEPVTTKKPFIAHLFNGTHHIQYVPSEEDREPEVPEGATLGQPQKTPDGQTIWPLIYSKPVTSKPEDEPMTTEEPFAAELFNGTHHIQYIPFEEGKEPEVPDGATLGQPQRTPDGQTFWPLIYTKPVTSKPEDEPPTTVKPFIPQLFNGTHYIQYVPFEDGKEPEVPEGATLGQPQRTPDGQTFWPLIYSKPVTSKPEDESVTTEEPFVTQLFNGSHYIQYIPFTEGFEPQLPEEATMGEPLTRPDGQKYWPVIYEKLPTTAKPEEIQPQLGQVYNGTNFIKYVPYRPNHKPQVPKEATVGQPVKGSDGQLYWPIISSKPLPDLQEEPVKPQVFNGTHYIQYVPYREEKPEVPEGASLGLPETRPDGQKYWPVISKKPLPGLPITTLDEELPTTESSTKQVFNGTHYIQFAPYEPGQRPVIAEGATLGEPTKGPNDEMYWPIIYEKPVPGLPVTTQSGPFEDEVPTTEPVTQQVFNGTHYIQYVPYKPGQKPVIPEEATLGNPIKGQNDQMYWPIVYQKPVPGLPVTTQEPFDDFEPTNLPVHVQFHNGTHYIQYVPYKPGQRPVVPEDATLGKPVRRPDNQLYWPIIHMKPVEGLPIASHYGPAEDGLPTTAPVTEQYFNGTHYIQYVPYRPGQRPVIPDEATLGNPIRGPNNQMYWPIIYLRPVPGLPITTQAGPFQDAVPTSVPVTEQYFNGTHYIQYVPYKAGQRPVIPDDATLGNPTKGPNKEMYWPIVYLKPVPGLPITTQLGPFEDAGPTSEPITEQYFNGTHYIQYIPYKPGLQPILPEGASLGQPTKAPNEELFWPVIYQKPIPGLPITTQPGPYGSAESEKPITKQVFNGTHYIHYLPFEPDQKPMIPEGATIGTPTKAPNGQMYYPVIDTKPFHGIPFTTEAELFENVDTTTEPVTIQVFNGTHHIHYIPYKPGQRPMIPVDATLGNPTLGPNHQMYWPVIYPPAVTTHHPSEDEIALEDPTRGQLFNGTHYIQYVPYRPTHRPVIPPDAKLGKPMRGQNGQMYWPIIHLKPVPGIPIVTEKPFEEQTPEKGQFFNGTHYIQYIPYTPGHRPVVPEGATLGHPEVKSDGKKYWPVVRSRPAPGIPINWMPYEYTSPRPEQIYNGTHYIQYLPYNPTHMPEVPEGATLGHAQKGPGGQMYWVIISDKPIPAQNFNGTHVVQYVTPVTPEHDGTDEHKPSKPLQVFNGTHYIQYVPYTPGQQPVVPEGAVLGKPTKGPEGETYWPIVYKKRPVGEVPSAVTPNDGQIFNGTHYIRYVPHNPNRRPNVPEGASISAPQRGPDGQRYWVISSKKPLPAIDDEPVSIPPGQIYNGTHYIQYVPYNPSQMPQVPEGAVLGHPQKGPEGQMNWVIISDKPLPAQPGTQYVQYVTPVTPEDNKFTQGLIYNGTHYIQYVPYKQAQIPHIPNEAVLGDLEQGPEGQMYWPIIFRKPPQGPIFNGTHYVTYAPKNTTNIDNSTKDHPFWDYGQYGGSKIKPSTTESYPSWSRPVQNATKYPTQEASKPGYEYEPGYKPGKRPGGEDSYETIDEDHLIEYPSGSDYDETQEQPYGPGTCRYAGKVYVSAQQIPRDDPCDFCFCFRSDIICLQQSCPPPIPGCHEEPIQGFCCPRYECHVRMATLLNVTSTTTTTTTTLPPHFLSHVYNGAAGRTGCFVQGKAYRVGQAIASASGPCMDCICGGDGKMKCEPKVCTPEPMVRQMMVSTERAMTANHR